MAKLQLDRDKAIKEFELKAAELQRKYAADQSTTQVKLVEEQGRKDRQTQEVAVKLNKGTGI
jgi:hypothetical protein